ncbi:thiamine pyrophosphate-dependent enzyme [Helicobacter sp. MIT 01-3238]|uniref:thiamine pyrophosphate-dependent enzyme n=1 Tax=Helicobacter sp. MIT 01-3238 TaxID=398627 RepID=UPI000E1F1C02|nr:thiamine pyrophosphate-dependent enzyme [Helicobacter sp. MIT 01-3238]RDU52518.1 phosphonopyruvate decarboxylase [Helicobacter sp. MIT 01-3238]
MQTEAFGAELKRMGFCDFVGVPCSYLAPLINWAINENVFVMANNEGEAVAIASGVSLACALPLSDKSGSACAHFVNEPQSSISSLASHNPDFSSQMLPHENAKECNDFGNSVASKDSLSATSGNSKNSPSLSTSGVRGWVKDSRENAKNTSALGEVLSSDFKGCANTQAKIGQKSPLSEAGEASPLKSPTRHSPRKYGVVLMQNSGLSNALSPLTSLNHTFEIPILGFVSLRGEPNQAGQNTDEPQHELLGKITDKLLQTCQIECAFLDSRFEVACEQLAQAKKVLESNKSFFFIVRNSCFEKVALKNNPLDFGKICHTELSEVSQKAQRDSSPTAQNDKDNIPKDSAQPTRLEALSIIQNLGTNCALLATTGKCGRELYELDDRPNQLYMVGSMGCVSALGLGIALKSRKKVIAIDGDSALLMRLGTLSGNAYYAKCSNKGNLCHILLDNQSHDSTGGQFNLSPFVDFVAIAKSCGYAVARVAQTLDEFSELLREFVSAKSGGAWFIYLQIAKGSKKDLGRPKITPKQVALRFGAWLNENLECADTQAIKASKR